MPVVQIPQDARRILHKRAVAALGKRKMSVAPRGISRRDSLPALNAAAVVQVPQSVQCVLRKRDKANAEAPEMRADRASPLAQNSPLFQGGVALLFQTFPPLAQNAPVPAAPLPQPECTARRRRNFSRRVFPACSAIPKGALFASNTAPVLPKMSPRTAIFVDKREKF